MHSALPPVMCFLFHLLSHHFIIMSDVLMHLMFNMKFKTLRTLTIPQGLKELKINSLL